MNDRAVQVTPHARRHDSVLRLLPAATAKDTSLGGV